jgi:hypothetical protein
MVSSWSVIGRESVAGLHWGLTIAATAMMALGDLFLTSGQDYCFQQYSPRLRGVGSGTFFEAVYLSFEHDQL